MLLTSYIVIEFIRLTAKEYYKVKIFALKSMKSPGRLFWGASGQKFFFWGGGEHTLVHPITLGEGGMVPLEPPGSATPDRDQNWLNGCRSW